MAKVLVAGSWPPSLVNFRGRLLAELRQQGHEVFATAAGKNDEVQKSLGALGVKYHHLPLARTGLNPIEDVRYFLGLYRLMRRLRPDWVLAYTVKPIVFASLAARASGVPHVFSLVTGLGFSFVEGDGVKRKMINLLVRRLYRAALRQNHCVIFQNPDDVQAFVRLGLVSNEQAEVVAGSGVDVEHFSYTPTGEKPVFLLIARLLRDKGIVEYVEAAKILKRRYGEARFMLLGWIDENPAAISKKELDAWVRSGVIEYYGRQEDVRPYIAQANVYVLPSYREGMPRTVLEAMAMGRPIVTTDVAGCRETVVPGRNGFLVPARDPCALAAAMERFILHPEMIEAMGRQSRKIAEEKFDVRKVNRAMLQILGLA